LFYRMRLCLLNPNSTESMTEEMSAAARAVASPGTEVAGVTATSAPPTIEGYRDEAIAAAAVAEIVEECGDSFDAIVIACFGDPGLQAARQISNRPVVGIAEASFMLALGLGYRFAILTNTQPDIPEMEELVRHNGVDGRCSGVEAVELGVAEADADRDAAVDAYRRAGERAIEAGAEVLCLGCGPMVGLRPLLEDALEVPVIEAVPAGVAIAEAMLRTGLTTSKARSFRGRVKAPA
jgi:allantoin racemase